mgnify:CR=1 FL=1
MNLEKEKNGETRMKKYSKILRIIIYIAGLLILAFGIILNGFTAFPVTKWNCSF